MFLGEELIVQVRNAMWKRINNLDYILVEHHNQNILYFEKCLQCSKPFPKEVIKNAYKVNVWESNAKRAEHQVKLFCSLGCVEQYALLQSI